MSSREAMADQASPDKCLLAQSLLGLEVTLSRFFEGRYILSVSSELRFTFTDGNTEGFLFGQHRMALSNGLWMNHPGRIIVNPEIYICSSVMEAVSYVHLNQSAFEPSLMPLFIAIGLKASWPVRLPVVSAGKRVHFLFGKGLLEVLRLVKICTSLKAHPVSFALRGDVLDCRYRGRNYVFAVDGFSLSRFKQATGLRDRSRVMRPLGADSYFEQLRFSIEALRS